MLYGLDFSAARVTISSADRPCRRYAGPSTTSSSAATATAPSVSDVALDRLAIDRMTLLHRPALGDRLIDEFFDQMRGVILRDGRIRGRLDGAQNGRFERRVVLLEVQRDLAVGDLPAHRAGQELPDQRHEHADGHEPEGDDGRRAEPERLEARCRQEQRQKRSRDDNHRAPDGQALAPAVSH